MLYNLLEMTMIENCDDRDLSTSTGSILRIVKPLAQRLWLWLLSISIVASIPIVVSTSLNSNIVKFSEIISTFFDFLNKVAAGFQGTIGVAASIAGAIVTVHIANLALKLANVTVEISKNEQRRESERYAREIKTELINFSRQLVEGLDCVKSCTRSIMLNAKDFEPIFYAWLLFVSKNIKTGKFSEQSARGDKNVNYCEVALEIADNLLLASIRFQSETEDSIEKCQRYADLAKKIKTSIAENTSNPKSFVAAIGINDEIDIIRSRVQDKINKFSEILFEIEKKGFVPDVIMSNKEGEKGYNFLRRIINEIQNNLYDDDIFFIRLCMTTTLAHKAFNGAGFNFGYGERFGPIDAYEKYIFFMFIGISPASNVENIFQPPIFLKVASSLRGMIEPLCRNMEYIVNLFSLGIDGDPTFVPRPLMLYKPSSDLEDFVELLDWLIPYLRNSDKALTENYGLHIPDLPNDHKAWQKFMQSWEIIAEKELFGEHENAITEETQ